MIIPSPRAVGFPITHSEMPIYTYTYTGNQFLHSETHTHTQVIYYSLIPRPHPQGGKQSGELGPIDLVL